ncbi:MAG: polyphenol oxidase family protein [Planctomycetota bacterium]
MFDEVQLGSAQVVWRSSRLNERGVKHGFTTRALNVRSADDVAEVIRAAPWFSPDEPPRVILSKQVHGGGVDTPSHRLDEADAHVTDDPHEVVVVRTADCVPVLLSSADGRVVAAVHAGWRGLDPAVGVIGKAVEVLTRCAGAASADGVVAAVGPCVSVQRYEVGEEVAGRFRAATPQAVRDDLGVKPHLDTRAVAVAQLRAVGLSVDDIDVFPGCTFDDEASFFSYRREGPGVGHLAAMIAPRG